MAQFVHVFKMNQVADSIIVIWKFLCVETTRHSSGDEDCTCIKEDGSSDSDSDVEGATTYLDVDVPHTSNV